MDFIKRQLKSSAFKLGVVAAILMTSCDKDFEEMNINPNAYTEPNISALFTNSLIRAVGTGTADRNRTNIKYVSGIMQYHAALADYWPGDKGIYHTQTGDFFDTVYRSHLRELMVVIAETEGKPEMSNQNAIAKIWRVFVLHRVTDAYGNVPYKEAALGKIEEIYKPKYDKQSDIYAWMLEDLEKAINQINPSKGSFGAADVIYAGNAQKWKTFGYSLMLRLGMRLTKADAAMAQKWVQKAIEGGVMKSNTDMPTLAHTSAHANTWNWDARELKRESLPESNQGMGLVKMGKTFMDLLQANNDPRIPVYATLWEGNINSKQAQAQPTSTMPELQKGLPNGYDPGTIKQVYPDWNNTMLKQYSEPNTATIANFSSPSVIQSYAEVRFLLAEAALRGWGPGTAEEHYHAGIRASMEAAKIYPGITGHIAITESEITDYLAAHPLTGGFNDMMRDIHTQFYLAQYMHLEFFEAWSNWRRTGYPDLARVTYPTNATGGLPIRRLMYSPAEQALNGINVEAAIAAQGPDLYTTRVWWDKE